MAHSPSPSGSPTSLPSTALLTDHYELTMLQAALRSGTAHRRSVFELFARRLPEGRRYGVVAGVGRALDAVERFRFGEAELAVRSLEHLGVGRVDVAPDAPRHLARWRAETSLAMPGCCVLLAAQSATRQLATFDDRLAREALRLGFSIQE